MTEWGVFLVITSIVGFLLAVGGPAVYVVKTLVKITTVLDRMQKDVDENRDKSVEAYRELWEHNDKQDAQIAEHDREIYGLKMLLDADPN